MNKTRLIFVLVIFLALAIVCSGLVYNFYADYKSTQMRLATAEAKLAQNVPPVIASQTLMPLLVLPTPALPTSVPTTSLPPTATPTMTSLPTAVLPTKQPTLRPTDTPVPTRRPAETPIPPPAPVSDATTPGSILEIGQTWQQGGLELTMIKSSWGEGWADEGGGVFQFKLSNLESYDRSFSLSSQNFSAVDNRGRSVPVKPIQNTRIDDYCPSQTVRLPASQTIDLSYSLKCPGLPAFALSPKINAGDVSITEIIISASVSNINNARWRIRIHH